MTPSPRGKILLRLIDEDDIPVDGLSL